MAKSNGYLLQSDGTSHIALEGDMATGDIQIDFTGISASEKRSLFISDSKRSFPLPNGLRSFPVT